jgi:hypothetical protein
LIQAGYQKRLIQIIKTNFLTRDRNRKAYGAEYYSALSGKTNIIKGLETKEPYLENLKRFGE